MKNSHANFVNKSSLLLRILSGILIPLIFLTENSFGKAQIVGDTSLLSRIALLSRSNLQSIRTWKGKAEIKQKVIGELNGKPWDYETTRSVVFAVDNINKRSMFLATQTSEKGLKNGELLDNSDKVSWGQIKTRDGVSTIPRWYSDSSDQKTSHPVLQIGSDGAGVSGIFSPDFDPLSFFLTQDTDVYSRLMDFYKSKDSKRPYDFIIESDGSVVKLSIGNIKEKNKSFNQMLFDLNQGGSPTGIEGRDSSVNVVQRRNFIKVGESWVPSHVEAININKTSGKTNEIEINFSDSLVNEALPDDLFDAEKLIKQKFLVVFDQSTGDIYYNKDFISGMAGKQEGWKRYANWFLGIGCIILVLGLLLGSKVFGLYQNKAKKNDI